MLCMLRTRNTFHFEISPLNDCVSENIRAMLVTLDTSHLEMSLLNEVARENMADMSCTLDTSHLDISPLNDADFRKRTLISVTRDTSHSPMSPCGPSEQSPSGDNARQPSMAVNSSSSDCGENTAVVCTVDALGSRDSSSTLLAPEGVDVHNVRGGDADKFPRDSKVRLLPDEAEDVTDAGMP